MKRTKRIGFWAVTLLLSAGVSFAVAEMAVRLLGVEPHLSKVYGTNVRDPYLPYKPKPLSVLTGTDPNGEYEYDLRHNSLGFRDVEHEPEKPHGVFRILGLGDSFTYAGQVKFDEMYLTRLETLLNEREGEHPRVEIIKAGIPRYFPEVQRILLDKYGRQFSPDLVLVGFLVNDVIDTAKGMGAVVVDESGYLKSREAAELGSLGVAIYKRSAFMRLLLRTYVNLRIGRLYPTDRNEVKKADGLHEKDWRKVEEEYGRMAALAGEWGGRVAVAHIPQRGPWEPADSYAPQRLAAWGAGNGVFMVDTLPDMKTATEKEALYLTIDGHCNAAGNEVIAQTLFRELTLHGLVP